MGHARRLVCLGDLFDYWLGPEQLDDPQLAGVFDALRGLTRAGVVVDFIHGNRDFHVGRAFSRRLGVRVHRDALDLRLPDGRRVHICHGDMLCTADARYHAMRRAIRGWPLRWLFRELPFAWRERLACGLRSASQKEVAAKSQRVLGIVPAAVAARARRGADVVVCGHVHREAHERLRVGGAVHHLYSVGDWDERGGSYLAWTGDDLALRRFERDA